MPLHLFLVGDLKRMHQSNEEAYLNPESRRGTGTMGRNDPTPREGRSDPMPREGRVASPHKMAGKTNALFPISTQSRVSLCV